MRVLVTGGAGFIGSNFVRNAIAGNYQEITEVIVLDKLTYAGNLRNFTGDQLEEFEFIQGDIRDSQITSKIFPHVDAVINFAAESHVDRSISSANEFVDTNVGGVQNLLDQVKENPKVKFVQISTDEVYGSIETGSWDESQPILPNSPYSASKASAEMFVRAYKNTYDLNLVITRCSNNYGKNHYPEKLIPLFITNLIEGKPVPIYGNGLNIRDWLHVDDHCHGIYLALTKGFAGETYNFGGGRELSNLEITKLLLDSFGKKDDSITYIKDRLGHDFRYAVDWTKSKNQLGYTPNVSFEDGLQRTIDWYKDNEKWWKPLKK